MNLKKYQQRYYKFSKEDLDAMATQYHKDNNISKFREKVTPFICFYSKKLTRDPDLQQEFMMSALERCNHCLRAFHKSKRHREFGPYLARFLKNIFYNNLRIANNNKVDEFTSNNLDLLPQASMVNQKQVDDRWQDSKSEYANQTNQILALMEKLEINQRLILKLYHGFELTANEKSHMYDLNSDKQFLHGFLQKYCQRKRLQRERICSLNEKNDRHLLFIRRHHNALRNHPDTYHQKLDSQKMKIEALRKKILRFRYSSMTDIAQLLQMSKATIFRRIKEGYARISIEYQQKQSRPLFGPQISFRVAQPMSRTRVLS